MTNDTKSCLNPIMALNTTVMPLSFKTGLSLIIRKQVLL
jgi:hypothetical protein